MAASLQIIFGLGLLAFYHSFFIFFGFTLLVLLFILIRFTSKAGYETSLKESSYKYKIANWLSEINSARISFKTNQSDEQLSKTDAIVNDYLDARKKHFKVLVQQYQYLVIFKILIALCLLIVGGILVVNQQMNIGQFVAAEIIIVLVLSSVEKIILNLDLVYDVLTAIEKIGQVTDIPLESDSSLNELPHSNTGVKLTTKELNFNTEEFLHPLLKNVSLEILQNEKVSIISDSSSSSNALFLLILGVYEEFSGTVLIDNIPIENMNKESMRNTIGTLLAQDKILHATWTENIVFGKNDLAFTKVIDLVDQLGMKEFVESLVNKYDYLINPDSYLIPTEIQKKILIARAIIRNPRLLMLEDPTGGLNEKDQKRVMDTIFSNQNCSIIFATNDSNVHAQSDKIIEIQKGEIVFVGNFESYINYSRSC
jgi:ABC-type bacteriocin/lantibiotic exporter with double-glycine peptidase domain